MKKTFLTLLTLTLHLFSNPLNNINTNMCAIPDKIMLTILMAEGSKKRELGYPYIIRINGKDNIQKADTLLKKESIKKLSRSVYDCINKSTCKDIASKLIDNKITNMDLGPFQTNYYFHPSQIKNFFSLQTAFLLSCKFNHENINRFGYSWKTIARYHSGTPKLNRRYQNILIANYKTILEEEN